MKTAEKELMNRVLDTLEQMLCEVSGASAWGHCFPSTGWQHTVRTAEVAQQSAPAQSAYFCLASASALVDVTRSLLEHIDVPCQAQGPDWVELSNVSRAAGQSAYLASVILAGPAARPAGRPADDEPPRHRRGRATALAPSSAAARLMGWLLGLFEGRPAPHFG